MSRLWPSVLALAVLVSASACSKGASHEATPAELPAPTPPGQAALVGRTAPGAIVTLRILTIQGGQSQKRVERVQLANAP